MAEAGHQAPNSPAPPPPPAHSGPTQQLQQHAQQMQQAKQVIHMNQSHFKPEFSGKPEVDAEGHLL